MKREALESLMPLVIEMLMDGIEVKIKPTEGEYPDMEFYVRETDAHFLVYSHNEGKPYFAVSSIINREARRTGNSEHYFSALSLVMQGVRESRLLGGF